ncbi:MAG: glycosyltransferase family 4 protein [archaeon]|nr:glycosyltransferase family 4 protein [archaeon]
MIDEKRIIYLTFDFIKPIFSGNGQLSRIQVLGLIKSGFKLLVICPKGNIDLDSEIKYLIKEKKIILIHIEIKSEKDLSFKCDWSGFFENSKKLKIITKIQDFNPHLIIGIDWHTAELAIYLKNLLQIPLLGEFFRIFSFFNEYFENIDEYKTIRKKEENLVTIAEQICVLSSFDKNWAYKHNATEVNTLYPPVSEPFFEKVKKFDKKKKIPKKKKEYKLMTLSRVVKEKKIHRIIPIIAELKKLDFKFKYHLFGEILDDKYWKKLQHEIISFDIEDLFVFSGEFLDIGVIPVYIESDCYIHTSEYEPFGLTIIEAALTGCPIFLDKNGLIGAAEVLLKGGNELYMDEIKNNSGSFDYSKFKNGVFLLDYNKPILAGKFIIDIMQNDLLVKQITANAKKYAETLTISKYISNLVKFINEII